MTDKQLKAEASTLANHIREAFVGVHLCVVRLAVASVMEFLERHGDTSIEDLVTQTQMLKEYYDKFPEHAGRGTVVKMTNTDDAGNN